MYLINGSVIIVIGVICYFFVRSFSIGIRIKKQRHLNWLREIILFLFALYSFMVVSVTLFPIPIGFHSDIEYVIWSVNLIPLKSIIHNISLIGIAYGGDVPFMIGLIARNVGGNILLLMPLGFLAPLLWNSFKSFKKVVLIGLLTSISIEILQFLQSLFVGGWGRITDIDDVICNVLGTMIGFLLYKLFIKIVSKFHFLNLIEDIEKSA